MTLILAATSREGIWLLADRRLSRGGKSIVRDDARKILKLEGTDGVALLGYSGLGETVLGTEPSKWISTVIRGRGRFTIEQALGLLTKALRDQLPRHFVFPDEVATHWICAPALINDQSHFYTIEVSTGPGGKGLIVEWREQGVRLGEDADTAIEIPSRLWLTGSGGAYLFERETEWFRPLLRLLHRADRGRSRPYIVADYLAELNYRVHDELTNLLSGRGGGTVRPVGAGTKATPERSGTILHLDCRLSTNTGGTWVN